MSRALNRQLLSGIHDAAVVARLRTGLESVLVNMEMAGLWQTLEFRLMRDLYEVVAERETVLVGFGVNGHD